MSETVNLETSGRYMARFVIQGKVKSAPRIVSNFIPGEVKDIDTFKLVVADDVLVVNGEPFNLTAAIRSVHEKIRQVFAGGSYTDVNGIICDFSAPQAPWWVAISDISWALLEKFEDWSFPSIATVEELRTMGELVQ